MIAKKSSRGRKYGKAVSKTVASVMRRKKKGTLRSGSSGNKVTSRKQAIAIGLSEARKKGAKVPKLPRKGSSHNSTRDKQRGGSVRSHR